MDYYIGAIWSNGFNFAPRGTALCNGQLMSISQNEALFALIGNTYGGDGQVTFGLPDLQGRVPIGTGQGPGLPNYVIGQAAGSESVTLIASNLPPHSHPVLTAQIPVSSTTGETNDPTGHYFAGSDAAVGKTYNSASGAAMAPSSAVASGIAGSNIPISILSPYLTVSYCIAIEGIFPSRN